MLMMFFVCAATVTFSRKSRGTCLRLSTSRIWGKFLATRDHDKGTLFLNQEAYLQSVIKMFKMESCHPVSTPLCTLQQLVKEESASSSQPYQQLIAC
jgi:hypothetical protein